MWFRNPFKGMKKADGEEPDTPDSSSINQGVFYLYMIIGAQIALVFGLLAVVMFVGRVVATPLWVFLFALALAVWGFIIIYRKAKRQLLKLRDAIQNVDLSDRNFEISVMGGFLTMRMEQNPRRLLEAPRDPILEPDTIEPPPLS
jgi:hypothetical protein